MPSSLPQHLKLTVVFRVESGCLGPDGHAHVDAFCAFAERALAPFYGEFVHWQILPRRDKSLPEMQYMVGGKTLSHGQAAKYLEKFAQDFHGFEAQVHGRVVALINRYLGR